MNRPDHPRRPRRLLAVLTVALPLAGTPAAVTAVMPLGDAAHRAVPSATVPASVAAALIGRLAPGVLRPYGR
ncbi:hypothetical protein [Streptomyces sp. CBMA156]|uniref:hypothetical protein n=1 Tax=Streptomyces sp. CBMA156 TaxID=1930280 RepID=UPI001661E5DE|nr:hypothetical protein [Streptomyces sp. CBMA156]MBD0675109.1 hypothetical protein [Streptomyces sp. CBMA156]MBD0675866.1 hypothetical protein [Streptomyces sp. CBMA156]